MGFFRQLAFFPAPFAFMALCAEFLGGIGLILGLLGRVAAFGIACNMIAAVVMVHWRFGLFANWAGNQKREGIEFHLLAIAIPLAIMTKPSPPPSIHPPLSTSSP